MHWSLNQWNSLTNILNEKNDKMPVQINEIIVKAVVDPKPGAGANEPVCPPSGGGENEIAEKILEILREKKER